MVLEDFLRGCAFFIDSTVYRVIPLLYKLIIYLANVNFTGNSNTLSTLTNRIYALVGIFMLFKLSFSILRYIVDPDSFSDSSKGFSNFVRRVLVAFVLLATVPYIFNKMYDFQNVLLSKNVIPNLILGTDENKVDDLESAAKDLQFLLFGSFFTINYDASSFTACTPSEEYPLANVLGSKDMVRVDDGACLEAFSEGIKDRDIASYGVALEDYFKTADDAGTISDMRRFEAFNPLIKWKDANKYSFDYLPLSIICGIYLVFLLLSFCIDIAGRAIRLLFMQALSPVAIVSSVDPASSSQGEKLKEWIMECLKVFFSLFIRLAVIYSVIQLVKIISESVIPSNQSLYYNSNLTNTQGGKSMNLYIYIFLILGSFQVAKKIPELLEKALGIKFSGELQLNPFKNEGVGSFLGGAVGAGATSISSMATAASNGKSPLGVVKSGLVGLGVGAVRGAKGGYGKNMSEAFKAGTHAGGIASRNMLMRRDLGIGLDFGGFRDSKGKIHPLKGLGKVVGSAASSVSKTVGMNADSFLDKSGGPDIYQMKNAEVNRLNVVSEAAKNLRASVESGAASSKAHYRGGRTYEEETEQIRVRRLALDRRASIDAAFASSDAYLRAKEQIDNDQKAMNQRYYNESINQELTMLDGTAIRDFDVENGLKDVESARTLLDNNAENKSIKEADLRDLDSLKKVQIDSSNNSKTIQSTDSYRDSKKRHETRANVSQERFYETSGK